MQGIIPTDAFSRRICLSLFLLHARSLVLAVFLALSPSVAPCHSFSDSLARFSTLFVPFSLKLSGITTPTCSCCPRSSEPLVTNRRFSYKTMNPTMTTDFGVTIRAALKSAGSEGCWSGASKRPPPLASNRTYKLTIVAQKCQLSIDGAPARPPLLPPPETALRHALGPTSRGLPG